jgi:putative heme iron utilization protein
MDVALACRELASRARIGSLATLARDPAGHPFATLVAVATDPAGQPLFYLSALAEHTKNLRQDPRASLLVWDAGGGADPLAAERVTLIGLCAPVPADAAAEARSRFLSAHTDALAYASLPDFAVWRLAVAQARWIGGFGRMTWVEGDAYARPAGAP